MRRQIQEQERPDPYRCVKVLWTIIGAGLGGLLAIGGMNLSEYVNGDSLPIVDQLAIILGSWAVGGIAMGVYVYCPDCCCRLFTNRREQDIQEDDPDNLYDLLSANI